MKSDRFYLGTIKECTVREEIPSLVIEDMCGVMSFGSIKSESKVYKENALLLKTRNGLFIDVEGLSVLDIIYLYFEDKKSVRTGESFMFSSSIGSYVGNKFVDSKSLRPYVTKEEDKDKDISLLSLRYGKNN